MSWVDYDGRKRGFRLSAALPVFTQRHAGHVLVEQLGRARRARAARGRARGARAVAAARSSRVRRRRIGRLAS